MNDRTKQLIFSGPLVEMILAAERTPSAVRLDEAACLLRDFERTTGVMVSRLSPSAYTDREFWDDAWVENSLFPFLTLLGLVWTGDETTDLCIRNDQGEELSCTWRMWGDVLARWANAFWFKRPRGLGTTDWTRANRPWEYLDFYMADYFDYLTVDYNVVVAGFRQIVTRKDALFGFHLVRERVPVE